MPRTVAQKRSDFRAMHARGCFVIPNPWDAGSARMLELCSITSRADGVTLSLMHFNGDMVVRASEKAGPFRAKLATSGDRELVFEGTEGNGNKVRLTYRRNNDELTVTLEKVSFKQEFKFQRAAL